MGKSALALQIARDLADQLIPTLFLSLEMDTHSMVERIFCQMMEIDNFHLLSGRINHDDEIQKKWETFSTFIKEIPLLLTNGIGKTFAEVNELINLLDPKPKCVIVDYIQAVKQERQERTELNEYIRSFRQLMIEHDIAGILCSQMNRQVFDNSDNKPTLENLKSTGVLEEHADVVLMLYWKWFYTRDLKDKPYFEIILGKNRNGRTGRHELIYIPEYYLFKEDMVKKEHAVGDQVKVEKGKTWF